jgi:hypothetical protein
VFIIKIVKVVCFDTLLQVLIVKSLYAWSQVEILMRLQERQRERISPSKSKNASRDAGATMPGRALT